MVPSYETFIFDCDGVLWNAMGPFEKSFKTLEKLKEIGKNVYFVTNNSARTRSAYVKKFKKFGF